MLWTVWYRHSGTGIVIELTVHGNTIIITPGPKAKLSELIEHYDA